jgi:hypothetical protein
MTGLNLETFLRLLKADLGVWVSLGAILAILALMTWTSWGSKRALRKCLFLSIAVHFGLIVYGASSPAILKALRLDGSTPKIAKAERPVRITPWVADKSPAGTGTKPSKKVAAWDLDRNSLALAEPGRLAPPPPTPASKTNLSRLEPQRIEPETVAPEVKAPTPTVEALPLPTESKTAEPLPAVAEADPSEVMAPVAVNSTPVDVPPAPASRVRPATPGTNPKRAAPERRAPLASSLPESPRFEPAIPGIPTTGSTLGEKVPAAAFPTRDDLPTVASEDFDPAPPTSTTPVTIPSTTNALPLPEIRRATRPSTGTGTAALKAPNRISDGSALQGLARVTPTAPPSVSTLARPTTRRSLADVPSVYRSRLDPNRTVLAQRAGASVASEQAVERALDWLARHQDATDGRWDGGTGKTRDGAIAENDDSYTIHCPPGEVCFGECIYWEADTALTGLSLLAYLGSGYTHLDGKYATTVAKGLEFLVRTQKADGDLRGSSLAVGMYCHSMATLALCEAYALTGDSRLKGPVERAVGFIVRSRSKDGMAWRYSPGAADSDTSILGWAVMALKSAKSVGIPIPQATQNGMFEWLRRVSKGKEGGLAFYNFEKNGTGITPTMTAEAWACRQFLEVGGPGPASDEAANYLVRNKTDRGEFNIYYLYYGTLSMYQHGGAAWSAWNGRVRDDVVRRQRTEGHMAGSWDPDDSPYGSKGGRIYTTALATLTLEVYYRFLRLYEPAPPAPMAPRPSGDPGARRAGLEPATPGP